MRGPRAAFRAAEFELVHLLRRHGGLGQPGPGVWQRAATQSGTSVAVEGDCDVDASTGMGASVSVGVDVNDLTGWIDEWLGRLAGERQVRQEERRRAFVDGAIDALL